MSIFFPMVYVSCDANFALCFSCSMVQMLTSKDTNFIGFTFKKSDVLKSLESSGKLLWSLAAFLRYFCLLFVLLFNHFSTLSKLFTQCKGTMAQLNFEHLELNLHSLTKTVRRKKSVIILQYTYESIIKYSRWVSYVTLSSQAFKLQERMKRGKLFCILIIIFMQIHGSSLEHTRCFSNWCSFYLTTLKPQISNICQLFFLVLLLPWSYRPGNTR